MRPIGFSTGALARGDFRRALEILRQQGISVVELSALRLRELEPLVRSLQDLDLTSFEFISFHAPSAFQGSDEQFVTDCLATVIQHGIPVVVHPDVICDARLWRGIRSLLFIENMDKRKVIGRTADDLAELFDYFPEARLCFDIAHARQVDPTMTEARLILESFASRLAQVHISEVNTSSRHDPISTHAISAFRSVAELISEGVPIILETLIDQGQSDIATEIARARAALAPRYVNAAV
jgi:hypothetical protein